MKRFNWLWPFFSAYLAAALPENLSGIMRGDFYQDDVQVRVSEGPFWLSRKQQALRWDVGEDSWYFNAGRLSVWQRPLAQLVSYEGLPAQAESLNVLLGSEQHWGQQYRINRHDNQIDLQSWNGRTSISLIFTDNQTLSQLHWQMGHERLQLQFFKLNEQPINQEQFTLDTQGLDTVSIGGKNHDRS